MCQIRAQANLWEAFIMKAPPLGYRPLLRAGVASWLSWAWASRAHADVSSHLGALPYPVPWCPAPSTQPQAAALEEPGVRAVKLETQPPAGPAQVPLFLLKANTADTKGSRMGRSGGLLQSRAPGRKGGETEEGLWVLGRVCVS